MSTDLTATFVYEAASERHAAAAAAADTDVDVDGRITWSHLYVMQAVQKTEIRFEFGFWQEGRKPYNMIRAHCVNFP